MADHVEVLLPNGGLVRLAFLTPRIVARENWGTIELGTPDFFNKLSEIASRAERGKVTLRTYSR
jgi:hypothetical protein